MKIKLIHVFAVIIIITAGIILLSYYLSSTGEKNEYGEYYNGYWGSIASEIAKNDSKFIELIGDNRQVSGIIEEGTYAYLYYDASGKTYNVSVDLKAGTVTSIEKVNDEKTLKFLNNSRRLTMTMSNESGKFYTVHWSGLADEIASNDSRFRELIGNGSKVGGIIGEGTYAYLYYDAGGKTYNVSVDLKDQTVRSIEEVRDEKTLRYLQNVRGLTVSASNTTPSQIVS